MKSQLRTLLVLLVLSGTLSACATRSGSFSGGNLGDSAASRMLERSNNRP
jgi:hypothetical protein